MTVYLVRNGLTANGIAKNMGGLSNYTNNLAKPLASKTGWNSTATGSPIPALAPGNDLTTNNLTGFNALPGGYRASATEFKYFGDRALFWSTLAETFKITYGIFKISSHSPHVSLSVKQFFKT